MATTALLLGLAGSLPTRKEKVRVRQLDLRRDAPRPPVENPLRAEAVETQLAGDLCGSAMRVDQRGVRV